MLHKMSNWFWAIFIFCMTSDLMAAREPLGLGKVANNMMDPVSVVASFLNSACLLLGGAFIFASIVKFFEHKRSPTMVTLSTVVFLFLSGLVLLSLPLIAYLT